MKTSGAGFGSAWVVLGLAIGAASPGVAEEKAAAPDAATKERIEKCIRALGAADPAAREAAEQELAGIGLPAAEAVYRASKSGDVEVALRAGQVLTRLKWASPEAREKIRALRKERDANTWDRLWNELLDLGDASRAALEQEMTTPEGELKLEVEAPKRIVRGGGLACQVRLGNAGKTGIWIDRSLLRAKPGASQRWSVGEVQADHPALLDMPRLQRLIMRNAAVGLVADEEARYVYLAPGESSTHKVELEEPAAFDFTGRVRALVEYLGGDPAGRKATPTEQALRELAIHPAIHPQPRQGLRPVKITCLKKDVSGESDWVELVPDLAKAPAGLSLKFAEGAAPVAAAGGIPVRLALQNDGKEPVFFLSGSGKDQPGFWFALLDGKKEVAQFGRLGRPAGDHKGTELKPGETLEAEGKIDPSVPPGTYTLVCGFSGHGLPEDAFGSSRIRVVDDHAGRAGPAEPQKKEWQGDALTPPVEVTIPGGAK